MHIFAWNPIITFLIINLLRSLLEQILQTFILMLLEHWIELHSKRSGLVCSFPGMCLLSWSRCWLIPVHCQCSSLTGIKMSSFSFTSVENCTSLLSDLSSFPWLCEGHLLSTVCRCRGRSTVPMVAEEVQPVPGQIPRVRTYLLSAWLCWFVVQPGAWMSRGLVRAVLRLCWDVLSSPHFPHKESLGEDSSVECR